MGKLTKEEVQAIEEKHNVYVDANSMQYNIGGYDAVYGWQSMPQEWIRVKVRKGRQ